MSQYTFRLLGLGLCEFLAVLFAIMTVGEASLLDARRAGVGVDELVTGEFNDEAAVLGRQTTNLQTFTGALGGIAASPITNTGNTQRPFAVNGSTFTDFPSAASRSCSIQHNSCADLANNHGGFTIGDCDSQQTACNAAASTATAPASQKLVSSDANFNYFCDV